ncbi:unnamed protein product [Lathyrus sativus]|nr:unnamed protein product [Lathyrus sativus]
MDDYLHLKVHHSGEFVNEDFSVYEGGGVADLKIDIDRWSYFELLDCFKDLGYNVIEKIYYRDPTFEMNVLVDDKGVLEIVGLYRILLVLTFIFNTHCRSLIIIMVPLLR